MIPYPCAGPESSAPSTRASRFPLSGSCISSRYLAYRGMELAYDRRAGALCNPGWARRVRPPQVLARPRWPDTRDLFERVGVSSGMECLDLGSGGAAVTFELARLVGPAGRVVGVDMDDLKLALSSTVA